jgi:hypothetical protein
MSSTEYAFRRVDTDEIVHVDFEKMMEQDAAGYIRLDDGVEARRVVDFSNTPRDKPTERDGKPIPPSDAMGFIGDQLGEFEADRVANGFSGVEFVLDPMCKGNDFEFYQVKCSSRREWERYVAHRGMVDRNRSCGVSISPAELQRASEMVRERWKS